MCGGIERLKPEEMQTTTREPFKPFVALTVTYAGRGAYFLPPREGQNASSEAGARLGGTSVLCTPHSSQSIASFIVEHRGSLKKMTRIKDPVRRNDLIT